MSGNSRETTIISGLTQVRSRIQQAVEKYREPGTEVTLICGFKDPPG